jgi:hypothetical protein
MVSRGWICCKSVGHKGVPKVFDSSEKSAEMLRPEREFVGVQITVAMVRLNFSV